MADFGENEDEGPGTVNYEPGDFGPITLCQTLLKEPVSAISYQNEWWTGQ
jgi:hypothetical protein